MDRLHGSRGIHSLFVGQTQQKIWGKTGCLEIRTRHQCSQRERGGMGIPTGLQEVYKFGELGNFRVGVEAYFAHVWAHSK